MELGGEERDCISWSDIESDRYQLRPGEDVIVMDRVTYAGNVGSVLRHMPIFGAQVLFLTNSTHLVTSPYPSYTRKFVKEAVRVSMCRHYEAFPAKLCALPTGGIEELESLLRYLQKKGFALLALENIETLEEINASRLASCGAAAKHCLPHHCIYDESSCLRQVNKPLAFVFGGEVGGLPPSLLAEFDEGGYIPSRVAMPLREGVVTSGGRFWSSTGRRAAGIVAEEGDESLEVEESRPFFRTHSCNVSVAACVVLGERFRLKLTSGLT